MACEPILVSSIGTPSQNRLVPNTLNRVHDCPVQARYRHASCGQVTDVLPVLPSPCVRTADCAPAAVAPPAPEE